MNLTLFLVAITGRGGLLELEFGSVQPVSANWGYPGRSTYSAV
jgi:hypothetical protein